MWDSGGVENKQMVSVLFYTVIMALFCNSEIICSYSILVLNNNFYEQQVDNEK